MKSEPLKKLVALLLLAAVVWQFPSIGLLAAAAEPIFERDLVPVFDLRCGKCHSGTLQKGGLDLSTMNGIRRGGESGDKLVSESIDESLLWKMIEEGEMPPQGQTPLAEKEVDLVRRWIESGAKSLTPLVDSDKPTSQHDVLPILLLRCAACHGARLKQGGLDLRSLTTMKDGGKSGPALVLGDPDASRMIQRIESEACPPRELLLKFFVKRPQPSEVQRLRDWIAVGAPEGNVLPDIATDEPDKWVTDEDRQHWAFQPPSMAMAGQDSKASPSTKPTIDDFLLPRLRDQGLSYSPEASRETLIRRAYLDLVGMPPERDDWNRWMHHPSHDWYAEMLEHLLGSRHYGERWGRFWLDVAGYADSEGGISADPIREVAWKYRDYVIRAFNSDKPYDRFLIEQIAGDELLDDAKAEKVSEEMVENLIATGFLRMGIDQTGSRTMNFVPERLGVIGDVISVVGSGVMGLTLECAKCHSHKYDPIPQRDYYRFKAIFQGALDEYDWLSFKNRTLEVDTPERRQRVAQVNPPLALELKRLEAQLRKANTELQLETLRQHYPEQLEAERQATLVASKIVDNNRSLQQRNLVEKLQRAAMKPVSEQPESVIEARRAIERIEGEMANVKSRMEPPLTIRALWDRGDPSPTYVLRRGEHDLPGTWVGPGVPSVLTDGRTPLVVEPPFPGGTAKTGRRLALARWLTQSNHPLTSRVLVNRVWYHHFGSGLVRSLENFGVKGDRPTHPALLDWLAIEFVERGWSIKELHRMIMNSQAYRQSSQVSSECIERDPQNVLLSRMPLRRLEAEPLYDSLLMIAGALDDTPFGPPDSVSMDNEGLVTINPRANGKWRRGIYAQYRRTEIPTMMETFDYPEMGPNCLARSISTVSPQALMLMNNQHVHQWAVLFAAKVEASLEDEEKSQGETNESDEVRWARQIEAAYEMALCRRPSPIERRIGIESMQEIHRLWPEQPRAPLEVYCHTLLNSAAFLYID